MEQRCRRESSRFTRKSSRHWRVRPQHPVSAQWHLCEHEDEGLPTGVHESVELEHPKTDWARLVAERELSWEQHHSHDQHEEYQPRPILLQWYEQLYLA